MELKGSKTEKNLNDAFAGESMARNKYTFFAEKAREEGYEQIANIFLETARNEQEHAKQWFIALCGGAIPTTHECLQMGVDGETTSGQTCTREWLQKLVKKDSHVSQHRWTW